ncbi:hypothetical protein K457DRAFT_13546 [Linnemannia elongata AG-77]|uniref:Methyltransferase FkbM domain-containing protein n=1 Tax=Linnemannia elongata AG-77 TaxID=1314771 RepID=A0A197KD66_9FUNG|nr:hypothetical protein K457DRAFT_13546 [Linnemannia elongata AG-77]
MTDCTNCQVCALDALAKGIALCIHFLKDFIGDQDGVEGEGNTWKTLKINMKEDKHEWIDVLKVDIEVNEFAALNAIMD